MAISANRMASSGYTRPSNVFTNFPLYVNSTGGLGTDQGLVDILATSKAEGIYQFAQSKISQLAPMITNKMAFSGGLMTYRRGGNVDFTAKTVSAATTPRTTMEYDIRAVQRTILHQGIVMDMDMAAASDVEVTADFQMKLAYALARNLDKLAQIGMVGSVLSLSQAASLTWKGAVDANTAVALPDSQLIVRTTGAATPAIGKFSDTTSGNALAGIKFLDHLAYLAESKNLDIRDMVIVGNPNLRRQLKDIVEMRDLESKVHMVGGENVDVLQWQDWKFLILKNDAYMNFKGMFATKKYGVDGTVSSAGATTIGNAAAVTAAKWETCIMFDTSGVIHGTDSNASYMAASKLDNHSYADQVYVKAGVAFSRKDEDKVFLIVYLQ